MDERKQVPRLDPDLRRRAEERLHERGMQVHPGMTEDEVRRVAFELQVHQVELEMQNEELQRARCEAEEIKERYLDLYDFAPVGYFAFDIQGTILSANLTGAKLLGRERGALIGRRFQVFIDISARDRFSSYVQEVIQTRERRVFEVAITRDGEPICLHIEGIAMESPDESREQCRAAVIDITDRKQADEALRESEGRYRALIDASSQVLYHMSPDWREMRGLKGGIFLADTERPNRNWLQNYVPPEDQERVCKAIHDSVQTGTVFELEHRVIRRDRTLGWTFSRAIPLRDSSGEIVEWFGSASDITERKLAEEAMRHQVCLLQRALIPAKPPVIEGYLVASAYIPAFADQEIGGDFLDVFMTEAGKVGILIGDVSGKGIESAALAATTRSTVRAFAYDSSSPADAMTHANSLLSAHQMDYMQFVTTFLAVLDPVTGDISYCSAGHPPAIVSGENGDTELLYTHNVPLGVFGGVSYEERLYTLRPGDRLVLYTDGITEAARDSDLFGTEGLERVISAYGRANPDELVGKVLDAVRDWARGRLRDDTAVLIVRREKRPPASAAGHPIS